MRRYIIAALLGLSIVSYAQTATPTWYTIIPAKLQAQNLVVSLPVGTVYSFYDPVNKKRCTSVTVANASTVTDWPLDAADCALNFAKQLDVQQAATPINYSLINTDTKISTPLTIPALATVPPLPPIPPSTIPPIPVVFNGVKYGCSNISLDNTGTLTLVCK